MSSRNDTIDCWDYIFDKWVLSVLCIFLFLWKNIMSMKNITSTTHDEYDQCFSPTFYFIKLDCRKLERYSIRGLLNIYVYLVWLYLIYLYSVLSVLRWALYSLCLRVHKPQIYSTYLHVLIYANSRLWDFNLQTGKVSQKPKVREMLTNTNWLAGCATSDCWWLLTCQQRDATINKAVNHFNLSQTFEYALINT